MELSSLIQLSELTKYKLHAARSNGTHEPLEVFLKDRDEWHLWNSWQGNKNEFNRELVLSIIKFYPEQDTWLFGGVYEVISRGTEKNAHSYKVQLSSQGQDLIGRLKLTGTLPRNRALILESFYNNLTVSEILKKPYDGEIFPGYEKVRVEFSMLDIIYKNQLMDWKTALRNIAGVYLIADKKTGKQYVGSATGSVGIWSRWETYMLTGHGGNKLLIGPSEIDPLYAKDNFVMTLLEWYPSKIDNNYVIERENYWKEALLTRLHGYNSN